MLDLECRHKLENPTKLRIRSQATGDCSPKGMSHRRQHKQRVIDDRLKWFPHSNTTRAKSGSATEVACLCLTYRRENDVAADATNAFLVGDADKVN